MSLRFAILTALAERESTGIELARRFDKSIGYFWTASHQQIYRELDRLSVDGLAEATVLDGPVKRGQPRSFTITDAGLAALAGWAAEGGDGVVAARDADLVRLRAAAALDAPDMAVATLRRQVKVHEERLAAYLAIEARDFSGGELSMAATIQRSILRSGIEAERSRIEWCRQTLATLGESE
ncbi:PadR family transcriptional regulator [Kribbia dieselivorans]|uniref:PadR family transcriptional regulator n=1 Tax=Kribbia dieselivorans TaxID=331526 RepID=UPI00083830E6|nr:PadR family transcriptional regulator [Kribbia dieselivorans]